MQKAVELVMNGKTLRGMYHSLESSAKSPLVILFHGFTGFKSETHRIFLKLSRLLEKKGMAVLRFDFSGSGESDGDFEEMTFSSEFIEAEAILDYARALPNVDQSRIGLLGFSMGGAIAGTLAGKRSGDIKILVLWAPATMKILKRNLTSRLASAWRDERGCYDLDGLWLNAGFLEDLAGWDSLSSISNFNKEVLIINGSEDSTVPVEVARQYQEVLLKKAGLEIIEGADHTFTRHDWETEVLKKTVAFLTARL